MVKFNSKRFLAAFVATTMVLGSSLTAFAATGDTDASGSYEGNDISYGAPSITLPTITAGSLDYIADPNGLIRQSNAAKFSGYTFTGDTGVYFKTDATAKKYTEYSQVITASNRSAYPLNVEVILKQKTAGINVTFNDDSTFEVAENQTPAKEVYLALMDTLGNTSAIQATNPDAAGAAKITTTLLGKPSNYKLTYSSGAYSYALKSGVTTTSDTGWNTYKVRVKGAANLAADWSDATAKPPVVTMTWTITQGAAPVKFLATDSPSVTLSNKKADNAIAAITYGSVDLKNDTYTTIVSESTAEAGAVVKFTPAACAALYSRAGEDGAQVVVKYADDFEETIVFVKKY